MNKPGKQHTGLLTAPFAGRSAARFIAGHPLAAVFAFVTVCVLPMMFFRDPSPSNELRYLSIVDEALREGHFFCFYNHGIPYTDKPPLFFWLMMFFRLFCGATCMWLPVLFTALIPSFVTVAVMDKWLRMAHLRDSYNLSLRQASTAWQSGRDVADEVRTDTAVTPLTRILCASLLLAGMLFAVQTFFLRMDVLMTMFIVLALFTFWKMYTGGGVPGQAHQSNRDLAASPSTGHDSTVPQGKTDRWLLPLYIFLALFTKGPVGFFAPVLIIIAFLALEKQLRRLPEFLGWRQWLVMLLLFGGWILGAYLEGGREYINSLLFHQTLDRAVNAFTHKQPFWWYLPTLLYTVLPYTLLIIPAVIYLYCRQWRKRCANTHNTPGSELQNGLNERQPGNLLGEKQGDGRSDCNPLIDPRDNTFSRLLLMSIAVIFIMLSAFSGKLAIYLTPLLPLMAYLMPQFAILTKGRAERLKKAALLIPAIIIALAGVSLWVVYLLKGVEPVSKLAFALAINTPYIFSTTLLATAAVLAIGFAAACIVIIRSGWQKGAIAMAAALYLAIFAFGCTVNQINEWLGYRCVAEEALRQSSGTDTYNTLFVNRPENMDIYLGCEVTDYKDNVEAFITGVPTDEFLTDSPAAGNCDCAPTPLSGDHRGEVLIVKTSALGDCPPLREYLESNEGTPIGPFTVYGL
ncbi:MAG: hypothetical protein J5801_01620 [Bacteroidales bacterium]|nr:hypothetical protein [Bacteroidales bacterium]